MTPKKGNKMTPKLFWAKARTGSLFTSFEVHGQTLNACVFTDDNGGIRFWIRPEEPGTDIEDVKGQVETLIKSLA